MGYFQGLGLSLLVFSLMGCQDKGEPSSKTDLSLAVKKDQKVADQNSKVESVRNSKELVAESMPFSLKPHRPPSTESQLTQVQEQINEISQQNQHGTMGGKNPSYLQFRKNKVLAMVDFLYWKASEDGLAYAYENSGEGSDKKYSAKNLHFKYEPGFRLGIGYFFDREDQWDIQLIWTHLDSEANGIVSNGSLQIPWSSQILGEGASRAKAHWDLDYNLIDFELGRNFFVSQSLALRPFIGLRGAIFDQDYKVNYTGQFTTGVAIPILVEAPTRFKGDDDFWAVGFRPGLDLLWQFNRHWAVLGKISTSLLYGHEKTRSKSSGEQTNVIPAQSISVSLKDSAWVYRLNMEGALGVQWETYFKEQRYHVSMALAYEISQWYDQNQLSQTVFELGAEAVKPDPRQGTLGLHGFTYKLSFAF